MTKGTEEDRNVGYGRPPYKSRFPKGKSGNPKGRPKGRTNTLPYEDVLGQLVTIKNGGHELRVTVAQAFLLYMAKQGLENDSASTQLAGNALARARMLSSARDGPQIRMIVHVILSPGSVTAALEALRMARKIDRYHDSAKMMLEPWLVEAALERLGDRRLSVEEQKEIARVTRTPNKVKWPDWWDV